MPVLETIYEENETQTEININQGSKRNVLRRFLQFLCVASTINRPPVYILMPIFFLPLILFGVFGGQPLNYSTLDSCMLIQNTSRPNERYVGYSFPLSNRCKTDFELRLPLQAAQYSSMVLTFGSNDTKYSMFMAGGDTLCRLKRTLVQCFLIEKFKKTFRNHSDIGFNNNYCWLANFEHTKNNDQQAERGLDKKEARNLLTVLSKIVSCDML